MPLSRFFNAVDVDSGEGALPAQPAEQGGDQELRRQLKRQRQTKAARQAALLAFAKRRFLKQTSLGPNPPRVGHPHEEKQLDLQKRFFTGRLHHAYALHKSYDMSSSDPAKDLQRSRARCAWSLLCAVANALEQVFSVAPAKFVINTIVPDDTNARLKGPAVGDRSVVFTVMNQVTNCIVRYEDGCSNPESAWHCLSIPCPVTILNAANTAHLHAAYTSYLVAGALGIGNSLNRLGLSTSISDALGKAKWVAQVMTGDALETNSSTFHMERVLLGFARKSERPCNKLAIRLKCGNRQLCLIRRHCVLSVEKFWATIVRLGHLFECAGFRRKFTAAILSLLKRPGTFHSFLSLALTLSFHC